MFPIAPIISTVITFLQTVWLSNKVIRDMYDGAVSILHRVLDILSFIPPFDSCVLLVFAVHVFIVAVMCLLVFPILRLSVRAPIGRGDCATALAADVRDFYMKDITTDGAVSVVSIEPRMRAFSDKLLLLCIVRPSTI